MNIINERRKAAQSSDTSRPYYSLASRKFTFGAKDSQYSPYIQQDPTRAIYRYFDLLLPSNSSYVIISDAAVDDMYYALQFFSHAQLEAFNQGRPLGIPYYDTGWKQGRYSFNLPLSHRPDIAGMRIILARGINKASVVDSSMSPSFQIWRYV